ncbi:hypothetical protein L7F22_065076 [Adiantum nelumboides]|nr:hypothetical protein [Adiantum nelumboides]
MDSLGGINGMYEGGIVSLFGTIFRKQDLKLDPFNGAQDDLKALPFIQQFEGASSLEGECATSLNVYSCNALAGVATEYLLFGLAEGGLADVQQLDRLMRSLNFTQMKADLQVRWAVLNSVTILRRHKGILLKLASAMLSNKSVGECIDLNEDELSHAVEV